MPKRRRKRRITILDLLRLFPGPPRTAEEPCPEEDILAGLIEGILHPNLREKILDHMAECSRCLEAVCLTVKARLGERGQVKKRPCSRHAPRRP